MGLELPGVISHAEPASVAVRPVLPLRPEADLETQIQGDHWRPGVKRDQEWGCQKREVTGAQEGRRTLGGSGVSCPAPEALPGTAPRHVDSSASRHTGHKAASVAEEAWMQSWAAEGGSETGHSPSLTFSASGFDTRTPRSTLPLLL